MRKTLLLVMILLVVAAWAVAQQDAPSQGAPTTNDSQASPAAMGDSIDGCLGGSNGSFTVTDKAGNTFQLQLPEGADPAKLNQHVGEEVRVSGTMANSANGPSSNQIHVTKMDKIGDKCGAADARPFLWLL